MTFRNTISTVWDNLQYTLFPVVENRIGELPQRYKNLISVLELVRIEDFVPCTKFNWGRPVKDRYRIARAFIAKIFLKIPYTKQLVEQLQRDEQLRVICGWDSWNIIPSESTLSRAFHEFSRTNLADRAHQALIASVYQDELVMHVSKDSTPILAREKALKKEGSYKERKKKANERYLKEKKGEVESLRQRQLKARSLDEMVVDLPTACDIGIKKSSQGFAIPWKGYKLHVAIDDHCVALSAILTSASVNDCEVAIPLATKADKVAKNFYDLMDAAYDVDEIREHSFELGHVPIIDKNPRGTSAKETAEQESKAKRILNAYTAEDIRYKERFATERFNALYKDWFGGRWVYYKGHEKVFCHVMFGVLTLAAMTLLRLFE